MSMDTAFEIKKSTMHKRHFLLVTFAGVAGLGLSSCGRKEAPESLLLTHDERRLRDSARRMIQKFGNRDFQLVVDAMEEQAFFAVEFLDENSRHPLYEKSLQNIYNKSFFMKAGPIPERLRIIWRNTDAWRLSDDGKKNLHAGDIIGDETIEVGTRIPQELIDDLNRDPRGSLRLKFRMSNQGTLFGWDIERRPGFDPNKRDQWGEAVYVGPVHSFAGGDFREAEIFNGKPVRKGWYIDRRTGKRIETDY